MKIDAIVIAVGSRAVQRRRNGSYRVIWHNGLERNVRANQTAMQQASRPADIHLLADLVLSKVFFVLGLLLRGLELELEKKNALTQAARAHSQGCGWSRTPARTELSGKQESKHL